MRLAARALAAVGRLRRAPAAMLARVGRVPARRRRVVLLATAALTLVSVLAAAVLVVAGHRAQAITEARSEAVAQARLRVAEVLSYRADTIDGDIDRARKHTAGSFAQYYVPFAQRTIAPAVRKQGTSSVAVVSRAAPVSTTPDSVVVLVFIDQQTSSEQAPQARGTSSTARVTMTRIAGQWLISELTPTST
ncbi:hypothetical protein IQ251_02525 [Saccharopolyspora sp. HNM0983]|uniref:Mce-associated membrane protein n=1 Tax=Saccharopolyspora montiporae TaxID=2781240 RepID=A0A929G074_9PSEU|nr:hypothetical protein [Saccharopolyspora sp. HNM0983]MBE9373313.1 hypothetical protein [Saccharopolyspora sp. HNM0983]